MAIVKTVNHIYEANPLACGQAVISMLTGLSFEEVFKLVGKTNETTLKEMKTALMSQGITVDGLRKQAFSKNDLPDIALLSLETPKCWHWSLYFKGQFFDPEYGVLNDFPNSNRKYFWKIK